MIKILYISSFATLQGGGQRSLLLLLKNIDRSRFSPILAVPASGELQTAAEQAGVPVEIIALARLRAMPWRGWWQGLQHLAEVVKKYGISLVHADAPRLAMYAIMLKPRFRLRVIMHARVSDRVAWQDRLIGAFADGIIAVSQGVAQRFSGARVRVIYNAVDLAAFKPRVRALAASEILHIGYFGRIHPRKGIDVLLQSLRYVQAKVTVTVMGSGDAQYLERLKQISDPAMVRFMPYQKDIVAAMNNVDVVVLPACYREGLARIILEGLALGKVVLASDLPENREALGPEFSDWLFPKDDAKALARLIDRINNDPQARLRAAERTRARAEKEFNAAVNTQRIERFYDELTHMPGRNTDKEK